MRFAKQGAFSRSRFTCPSSSSNTAEHFVALHQEY